MYMDGLGPYCHSSATPLVSPTLQQFVSSQTIEAVQAVLRGECSVADAKGIQAHSLASTWADLHRAGLSLSASDLADGILNLKDDAAALADWASFIVVLSEGLSIEQDADYSDRLLSAIWDLAFGRPLSASAVRLASALRARQQKM